MVVDQTASGAATSWVPKTPAVFLGHPMTTRTYVIGGIAVLFLFVGFWLILHLVAVHQLASQNKAIARVGVPSSPEDDVPEATPAARPAAVATPVTVAPVPTTSVAAAPVRPAAAPVEEAGEAVTDAQIGKALEGGCNFLLDALDPNTGQLADPAKATPFSSQFLHGLNTLCVYALLQCGAATSDPRLNPRSPIMRACINAMETANDDQHTTYQRALRAAAVAFLNRDADRPVLQADVNWLLKAERNGAYTYGLFSSPTNFDWDNSNSQYGLLGVWSGAEADIPIPDSYWHAVENHWVQTQGSDGTWGYRGSGGGGTTMTLAGITSLFVAHDWLHQDTVGTLGGDPFSPALTKGLAWLETRDNSVSLPATTADGYALYSVARAGLASGFKDFGSHDWYAELAKTIIHDQLPDGSWSKNAVATSFRLLFLARGRHPVMMNKARFDGSWANYPRDAVNLARFASHELERPVNSQVVWLSHNWTDWTDCPILYLASHKAPNLAPRDLDNLRTFIRAGGLLYTQADGGSAEFNDFVADLAQRLFPEYSLADLPSNHPVFSSVYNLKPQPKLQGLSNGARLLMVHSPTDFAKAWEVHDWRKNVPVYRLGVNLFIYAAGRRDLRNRLDTVYVPAPKADPTYVFRVARLKFNGDWDPEPFAWTRFSHRLQWQTGYSVETAPVDIRSLLPSTAPFANLTGTTAFVPTTDEAIALRRYVEQGGVLLIDRCGGTSPFDPGAANGLLASIFPGANRHTLTSADSLLSAGSGGMVDLSKVRVRAFVTSAKMSAEHAVSSTTAPPFMMSVGKGHVLYSPLDLTCGLLGVNTWGIIGYEPDYAESFVRNALIWTSDGQAD